MLWVFWFNTRCVSTPKVKRLIVGWPTLFPSTSIGFPLASRRCTTPKVPRSIVERKKRVIVESRRY